MQNIQQPYTDRARRKVREIALAIVLTLAAALFLIAALQQAGQRDRGRGRHPYARRATRAELSRLTCRFLAASGRARTSPRTELPR